MVRLDRKENPNIFSIIFNIVSKSRKKYPLAELMNKRIKKGPDQIIDLGLFGVICYFLNFAQELSYK